MLQLNIFQSMSIWNRYVLTCITGQDIGYREFLPQKHVSKTNNSLLLKVDCMGPWNRLIPTCEVVQILLSLMKDHRSQAYFNEPVDVRQPGLEDYPKYVKV